MSVLESINNFFTSLSYDEIITSFVPLFFTIDILGCMPIVLGLKAKKRTFNPKLVAIVSGLVLIIFLIFGDKLLSFLGINMSSFSVAGGIILFVMAIEMVFGIEVFKEDSPSANATFVPLVFPLFAGAAAFTLLLTLKTRGLPPINHGFADINLIISIILNMIAVYLGLIFVDPIERFLGESGAYILRKFFGVILLAISVGFTINGLMRLIDEVSQTIHTVA